MNHEVVKLTLRSFTSHNASLVTLIRENPRYKKMLSKEMLEKFISHEMMVKDSKHIDDLAQCNISTKPHAIALKVTNEKEESPTKEEMIDVSGLDDEEMTLIIKSFRQLL
jgi:hypothetical protein